MSYQYWIIRFVPNIARGEFTNVGLVCGRDGGDWAVGFDPRYVRSHGNLSSDLRELSSWIAWFRRTVERQRDAGFSDQSVSSGWLAQLRSRQANSVQFSEPAPIEVVSAQAGVDMLFPHLVEREPTRRRRGLTRRSLRIDVRDTLLFERDLTIGYDLFVQPKVRIGKQRGSFDLLCSDSQTNALTNVWAFNVASLEALDREIQSWNYLVSRLRSDGANLELGSSRTTMLPADVSIDVVYDPPASDREQEWRSDIFEAAHEAWLLNGVTPRSVDEFHRERQDFVGVTRPPDASLRVVPVER
ncbi:MAG: DUF3037 domain-containing protein [Microlunatus sp.]